jgi:hypothetical protein
VSGSYGPSGSLFTNDRKEAPNHPDYEGYCEFSEEVVRSLVEQLKAGEVPKCDLKGWKKQSNKTGKTFLSLSAKLPYKRNSPDGNRQSGNSNRRSGDSNRRSGDPFDDFGSRSASRDDPDPWG